ncbi:hypothetical protein HPB47_000040 [Ixodes persulcatus]|uniref:Uncharacterized protein n=1 Tax=Ixodes persulcatus TaxID=34615 RepID=A0AC60PSX5_IXOPE|nr:hypothetical protein HPB47_000040 [Ixodes persulcatus]
MHEAITDASASGIPHWNRRVEWSPALTREQVQPPRYRPPFSRRRGPHPPPRNTATGPVGRTRRAADTAAASTTTDVGAGSGYHGRVPHTMALFHAPPLTKSQLFQHRAGPVPRGRGHG